MKVGNILIEPLTDGEKILAELIKADGEYVGDLYEKTHTMVHSRIADLRRKGHLIECKRFGKGDFRYRLVIE